MAWLSRNKFRSVDELMSDKEYALAIQALTEKLDEQPANQRLRLKLGDALVMDGQAQKAAEVLLELVDDYARKGFVPKAIAVLKKVERIDPGRSGIEEKLAGLVRQKDEESSAALTEDFPQAGLEREGDPTRSPLFSDFSKEELLAVIRNLRLLTFEPGEIIMTEGEPGDSLFVLTSGRARVFARNALGQNVPVRIMEEGEFFGEISILTGRPRTTTITSATACSLLELNRRSLDAITREYPNVNDVIQEFFQRRSGSPDEIRARSTGQGKEDRDLAL